MTNLIKNVSYDQTEIIRNILRLHVPDGKIDCDPTYSIGAFYRGTEIEPPEMRLPVCGSNMWTRTGVTAEHSPAFLIDDCCLSVIPLACR